MMQTEFEAKREHGVQSDIDNTSTMHMKHAKTRRPRPFEHAITLPFTSHSKKPLYTLSNVRFSGSSKCGGTRCSSTRAVDATSGHDDMRMRAEMKSEQIGSRIIQPKK